MKLLIATNNLAKAKDITKFLMALKPDIKTTNLKDLNIVQKAPETGSNYLENARGKALFYGNLTNLPTLADDSGFEIEYFNNEPGYMARLWPSGGKKENTHVEIVNYLRKKVQSVPVEQNVARLVSYAYFYNPITKTEEYGKGVNTGYLTKEENSQTTQDYPYNAFFKSSLYHKYLEELTPQEYWYISHRRKAIENLLSKINI